MRFLFLTQKMDSRDSNLGFFHRWVEEFAKNCESVIVVCLFEGEHALPKNVRVLSLGKESGVSRFKYLKRFFFYIWHERKQYDTVFVHMNQVYVVLGGLVWRVLGKKVSWWYAHGAVSLSMRMAEKFAQIIFTSTPQGFRLKSKKVHIVGQGIDTDLFKPSVKREKNAPPRIVSVGRISQAKGVDMLIKTMEYVCKIQPDAKLWIYGLPETDAEKQYYKDMLDLVQRIGLANSVHFAGAVRYSDLPAILGDADVFVQASQTGSMDKAVLEALSMNIPVVSTNPAFKETAEVTHVGHSAAELSDGVLKGVGRPVSTREYVERNHSLGRLVTRILEIIKAQ